MPEDHDTIVLQVPLGTKGRLVHAAERHKLTLVKYVMQCVDRPPNKTVNEPCSRCGSVVLTADGPNAWQCAQCGLVA